MKKTMSNVKRIVLIFLFGAFLLGTGSAAKAQGKQHFQFQFKNGHYLTATKGALIASERRVGNDELSQWFEVSFQADFSFKLAPLGHSNYYLTDQGGAINLKESASSATDWKVVYAGSNYVSIVGNDDQQVLADIGGKVELISIPSKLRSNEDQAGDHYRLKVISGEPGIAYVEEVREKGSGSIGLSGWKSGVQSYPNPMKDQTTVAYQMMKEGKVNISILDLQGRRISLLVEDRRESGSYKTVWDGTNMQGVNVPDGVYLIAAQLGKEKYSQLLIVR